MQWFEKKKKNPDYLYVGVTNSEKIRGYIDILSISIHCLLWPPSLWQFSCKFYLSAAPKTLCNAI